MIALSIIPLVVMLPSFSPFGLNQAQGQMSFSCPDGYQSSIGLCEPMVIMNPNDLECPVRYIKNPSGDCEWVGASSPMLNSTTNQVQNQMLNSTTNQTLNEGSLSEQQPPNTGGSAPLQQQPLTPPVQQQPYVQSQPRQAIPSPPLSSRMPSAPLPTSPDNCDPSYPGGCIPPPPN